MKTAEARAEPSAETMGLERRPVLKTMVAPRKISCVRRVVKEHRTDETEFSILISDHWQGKGLGSARLRLLVQLRRRDRLGRIIGHISAENITMKTVSQEAGFDLHFDRSDSEWGAEMNL
ncbi:MAG: hypothetical protein WCE87_10635 [Candidatus Udaeobacter sp.]